MYKGLRVNSLNESEIRISKSETYLHDQIGGIEFGILDLFRHSYFEFKIQAKSQIRLP